LRLVFVNSAWPQSWGGGEKWTVEAATWFQAHGHESLVVGRPDSRLTQAARERGLACVETSFGGDFDPLAVLRARRILKSHRADLVVVNFNKEAWQFSLAAKTLGIPVVARHGFPLLRNSFHHRQLLRLLNRLVVNAASIRDEYAALGLPVSGIDVIHNGTAIVQQKRGELRQRFGIQPDELLVLAAGRLESQKRFDRLIEIAARLIPQYPNVRILVAGDGPLRETLEQQVRSHALEDRVSFVGFLSDFAQICSDADLFLLTSDKEGTPNALLEAMAAGVACVSFGVGAVPEILSGDLRDNAVAPGDVEAMTARVALLLDDNSLRKSVGEQMRARAATEFSLDASMRKFEHLFQELIPDRS
jgi:glycosyltransferase involved in cell wall biosynthesis